MKTKVPPHPLFHFCLAMEITSLLSPIVATQPIPFSKSECNSVRLLHVRRLSAMVFPLEETPTRQIIMEDDWWMKV